MPRFDTTLWTNLHEAQEGGQDAVRSLVDRYRPPLVSYLRSKGLNEQDAEDVTQEVFLRFFSKDLLQAADRSRGRFRSYLVAVTSHVLSDWRRRGSAQKRGGGLAPLSLEDVHHELANTTTDETFDTCWLKHLLQSALEALRDEHPEHHALLTGVAEGKSPKQLAEELEKQPGAVRVGLHRARKKFAERLRAEVAAYCSSQEEYRDEIAQVLRQAGFE